MKSRALICTEQQQFSLEHFEIPALAPTDLLVRCIYSGVSVGTEFAVFRQKLNYGPFPVCTGYQAVGIVEDIGADVTEFKIGDKVYYRRNFIPMQHGGQPLTVCSGTHASYALMPETADVEVLPSGVDDSTGSLFVMPSVGYNAVDMAGVQMGEVVAIHAVGLIGLGALVAARLRGAVTIAIDLNSRRLKMAKELGATHVIDASTISHQEVKARVEEINPVGQMSSLRAAESLHVWIWLFPSRDCMGNSSSWATTAKRRSPSITSFPMSSSSRRFSHATMAWLPVARRFCAISPRGLSPGTNRSPTALTPPKRLICTRRSTGTRFRN